MHVPNATYDNMGAKSLRFAAKMWTTSSAAKHIAPIFVVSRIRAQAAVVWSGALHHASMIVSNRSFDRPTSFIEKHLMARLGVDGNLVEVDFRYVGKPLRSKLQSMATSTTKKNAKKNAGTAFSSKLTANGTTLDGSCPGADLEAGT